MYRTPRTRRRRLRRDDVKVSTVVVAAAHREDDAVGEPQNQLLTIPSFPRCPPRSYDARRALVAFEGRVGALRIVRFMYEVQCRVRAVSL